MMTNHDGNITFSDYLKAGYPALWVHTHENERAINVLSKEINQEGLHYTIFSWDIFAGLKNHNDGETRQMKDPLKPLLVVPTLPESSILFLKNFHRFINDIEIISAIDNLIPILKSTDKHLIFISPVISIPVELDTKITIFTFSLPSVQELTETAERIITENELNIDIDKRATSSAKGLTLHEAENAFALSLVKTKSLNKKIIENEKLQAIKKSGLMELYEPVPEEELGGFENLKKYIHNRKKGFEDPQIPTPKGIILVGLPGAGKSLSAKVISSVLDFPLIRLDISSLKSSLVGESEARMRQALNLIDAVAPCVVWLDEIEKALGGVLSSNRTDGGTTSAMFGTLLTWMQESKTPKYIVATCNDIDDLLALSQGALIRRFDDVFFVDLPNREERKEIIKIMNKRYNTDIPLELADKMNGWTGAEIEKFVKASIFDGIEDAFQNIKPIFHQNREKIEKAREWAKFNAIFAGTEPDVSRKRRIRIEN